MSIDDPFAPKKRYRSVSQLQQYEKCPHRYYLSRIKKEWQRPAAWLAQGTAVHAAIAAWELSGRSMSLEGAQAVFREEYAKEINASCKITPNFTWWFRSGPYAGQEDIERRYGIGLEQVGKYIDYATRADYEVIWVAPEVVDDRCSGLFDPRHVDNCKCRPATPGIELEFDMDLDGVEVKGFIDAVIWTGFDHNPGGEIMTVRDHKTGNQPGDDFQLGVYGVALAEMYDIERPLVGDYWMGKAGKPTYPFDLSDWTKDKVTKRFHELEDNIRAGRFDPAPEADKCRFCDVAYACEFSVA